MADAISNGHLSGNGPFTRRCTDWLEAETGAPCALLTHSCTSALELSALLSRVGPGDEVIMPSFTFVSTANAFVLRGATPVFVDVREDTMNLDESLLSAAVTRNTRVIVPVHYAGVGCEMEPILEAADVAGAIVVEDAAQGMLASHKGRRLGSIGQLGAVSFHETKNVISGEGGALLVNDPELVERAEILQEKGTDRSSFFRGEIDRYTWRDIGSSFAPSEINAAFLWAQLERAEEITRRRMEIWDRYHQAFESLEQGGRVRRPVVPSSVEHNAHLYYLLIPAGLRAEFIARLRHLDIHSVFHFVPLHSSPAGLRFGRTVGTLSVTDDVSARLVRLPLWPGMHDDEIERVIGAARMVLSSLLSGVAA